MVGYHEVDKVLGANRAFGLYGDMVIHLRNGTKLEMRSVPECALGEKREGSARAPRHTRSCPHKGRATGVGAA